MIKRKYVAIDAKKLHDDVFKANTIMNDGISVSARLVDNGLSDSVLANAVHNFKKGTGNIDISMYEPCEFGAIQPAYLNLICSIWRLDKDDYLCKEKNNSQIVGDDFNNIADKLDDLIALINDRTLLMTKLDSIEVSIDKLANIQMQTMEYIKAIMDSSQATASGIKHMNDKYNKPSAYKR